jgi:hypothetical protein
VKKPSLVVVVVDSSGSMKSNKLPAVQQTLHTYINTLAAKDSIALIDFDLRNLPSYPEHFEKINLSSGKQGGRGAL